MEANLVFSVSALDAALLPQISRILEARTNRLSRSRFPKLWRLTDRLNGGKNVSSKDMQARRTFRTILGVVNWILGMFLLLPGLMEPKELTFALLVGACGLGSGVVILWRYQKRLLAVLSLLVGAVLTFGGVANFEELGHFLWLGIVSVVIGVLALVRRGKVNAFDKAAGKLLDMRKKAAKGQITFSHNGMEIAEGIPLISYQEMEAIFETEDLFAPVYQEQIMLLQKKDLQGELEELRALLEAHTTLVPA